MAQPLLVILGPTASGKSDLAIEVARRHNGEIISADSRQIYVGMDIGTDKATLQRRPEPQRRTSSGSRTDSSASPQNDTRLARDQPVTAGGISHYLIDILTPDQTYSVAEFRVDAARIIADVHRRKRLPIVVGGTGYYIRALTEAMVLPPVPPDPSFRAWAEAQPLTKLVRELERRDPAAGARVDHKNRRRVVRALEVARADNGEGVGSSVDAANESRPTTYDLQPTTFHTLKLALLLNDDTLKQRITERVDRQLAAGLIDEVRTLVDRYGEDAPGLQAIGYREVFPFLRGEATLAETRDAIIRASWQYARRQITWLRKEPHLVTVRTPKEALDTVARWLSG